MTDVTAAALVAAEIGSEAERPRVSERLATLVDKLGVTLEGTYEDDVCSILEVLYKRLAEIDGRLRRLEERP